MKVVKELKDLMPILLKSGCIPNEKGEWSSSSSSLIVTPTMLTQCGQPPNDVMVFAPEWLEEKIEYPCIMQMIGGEELLYFTESHKGVLIDIGRQPSEWELGEWNRGWDMAHFKLYATINIYLGDEDAKENN